jgi:Calx-beta domain/FG-GAP-like repeat
MTAVFSLFLLVSSFFPFNIMDSLWNLNTTENPTVCSAPSFNGSRLSKTINNANAVVSSDFNNDGRLDIISSSNAQSILAIQLNQGNGLFSEPRTIDTAGFLGFRLNTGDFNNDGKTDILAGTSRLYFGDGTGNFSEAVTTTIDSSLNTLSVGDFNGDDNLDVAGNSFSVNSIAVYFGNGLGSFSAATQVPVAGGFNAWDSSDVNNDGTTDLTAVISSPNSVVIFLSNGNGTFQPAVSYQLPAGETPNWITSGDLNNDGSRDLLTTSQGVSVAANLNVLLGNGSGGFTVRPQISEPTNNSYRPRLVDINSDGKLDLASSVSFRNASILIRLGNGDGTFQADDVRPSLVSATGVIFEDFTGDGVPDIGTGSSDSNSFAVIENNGNGNVGVPQISAGGLGPIGLITSDFNSDGKPDVVSANIDSNNLSVFFGNGNGGFAVPINLNLPNKPRSLLLADTNGDGRKDILCFAQPDNLPQSLFVTYFSNGDGTFQRGPIDQTTGDFRATVVIPPFVGKANNDNFDDLFSADTANNRVIVSKSFPNGTLSFLATLSVGNAVRGVTGGDFNQDGKLDAAVLASSIYIFLGDGNGVFELAGVFLSGDSNSSIATADFNNDGILDLVAGKDNNSPVQSSNGKLNVLLGVGKGGFLPPREFTLGRGIYSINSADFDGDGNNDIAAVNSGYFNSSTANYDTRISILYGNSTGDFPRISNFIGSSYPRGLVIGNFDTDSSPDIITGDYNLDRLSILKNTCLSAPATNLPSLSLSSDLVIAEGDVGTADSNVTVSLSAVSSVAVRVKYYTAPQTNPFNFSGDFAEAVGKSDYLPLSGTLVFQPGETSKTLTLGIRGDTIDEYDEKFMLYLTNGSNATILRGKTQITISDNDAPPTVSIGNASIAEGNSGNTILNLPVTLSSISGKSITVNAVSGGGTATAGTDYTSINGIFTIQPNVLTTNLPVNVIGDLQFEPNETFQVDLTEPVNATIINGRGTATILNDDIGGLVQFDSATYAANEITGGININLTRTGGTAGGVSVRFFTQAGTATAGVDYTEVSTTVTFAANETTKSVFVPITLDQLNETDETVNLRLDTPFGVGFGTISSAILTIQDNDGIVGLSIADASVIEGDNGTRAISFIVRLTRPTQRQVSVNFATADGTAIAGSDYQAASGNFVMRPGVTRKVLNILVNGDFQFEPDETFSVNLSGIQNATLDDNQAIGRIINDELGTSSITSLVSINQAGNNSGNSDSLNASVSENGQIIAFESFATTLVSNSDMNGTRDIFVRNTLTGGTTLVSQTPTGETGNSGGSVPIISENGRFVVFSSSSDNLTNNPIASMSPPNVYWRDLQTNQTKLISIGTNGQGVGGNAAVISPDGRYVIFDSKSRLLTNIPDNQDFNDVFVRDTQLNTTSLVSISLAGTAPGNNDSGNLTFASKDVGVSANGRFVVFFSFASNLINTPITTSGNIFVRDLQTQTTIPISVNTDNSQLIGSELKSAISDDGRYVSFSTRFALAANDNNNLADVYRRDLQTNTTTLVSSNLAGTGSGNGYAIKPLCSADGRYITFESGATNLSPTPDTNQVYDIYQRDMVSGMTKLVSVNQSGTSSSNQFSAILGASKDGQNVLFTSIATDLTNTFDPNNTYDLFVRDFRSNQTYLASSNSGSLSSGNFVSTVGVISGNGDFVAFDTYSSNLVSIDLNGASDVFLFNKKPVGASLFDFDGDKKSDLSIFRPSNASWYISNSFDGSFRVQQFGLVTDIQLADDFDGDLKTDITAFRNGIWYIFQSRTNSVATIALGQTGDKPLTGDFDGDRIADAAVYRPASGTWFIKESSDGNIREQQFGNSTDIPVPTDFDGDRRTDLAVFRSGTWYIFRSSDFGIQVEAFGSDGDKPIAGDYDGDGKSDLVVFRPATGVWYLLNSSNNGFQAFQFGISTDIPLRGDYDGDGKSDLTIFRNGIWYIFNISNGSFRVESFGTANDIPIPR